MWKLLRWLLLVAVAGVALVAWISTAESLVVLRFANFTGQTVFITSVMAGGKAKYRGEPAAQPPVKVAYQARGFTSFRLPREPVTLQLTIRDAAGADTSWSCVFDNTPGTCLVEIRYWGGELSCYCDSDRVS
jgi:hypothetical protein